MQISNDIKDTDAHRQKYVREQYVVFTIPYLNTRNTARFREISSAIFNKVIWSIQVIEKIKRTS